MPTDAATAVLLLPTWLALQGLLDDPPSVVAASRREVVVRVADDGGFDVVATWWVRPLAGPSVAVAPLGGLTVTTATIDGVPVTAEGGLRLDLDAPAVVQVRGHGPGPFHLLPAAIGALDLPAGVAPIDDGYAMTSTGWAGAPATLTLQGARTAPPGDLIVSTLGLGVTVDDARATWSARIRWTALRGDVTRQEVVVPGLPADATWRGDGQVTRDGDRLVVTTAPSAVAELELSWSAPAGDGASLVAPVVQPDGVARHEAALQVARVGQVELVPHVDGASSAELPAWAQDLVDGAPTASFVGVRAATIDVHRFEPLPGPPVVVDVADWQVAASPDGRALIRGLLDVRNDRAQWLRVTPPGGSRLLSVTVDRDPVTPASDGAAGWLLPLPRSVEAVEGALSFPVELVVLVDGPAWARARTLELPVLSADVAVSRATVGLPRGWRPRARRAGHEVASFSQDTGLTYGLAAPSEIARADRVYEAAVDAWLANDFDRAQSSLDALEALGASNDNVRDLQQNLWAVRGAYDGDVAQAQRIQAQASARALAQEATAFAEEAPAGDDGGALAEAPEAAEPPDADAVASSDAGYLLDGANICDPIGGTFSVNFNYDPFGYTEVVVLREPVDAIATAQTLAPPLPRVPGAVAIGAASSQETLLPGPWPIPSPRRLDVPAPPRPPRTLTEFGEGGVTATRVALLMPTPTDPIRFEHLVVDADTQLALEIRARRADAW